MTKQFILPDASSESGNRHGGRALMKKRLVVILGLLVVAVLVFRILLLLIKGSGDGGSNFQRPPVAVEVARVQYGPIKDIRQFTGSIYPYYQYAVAPKVAGRIIQIRKRIGDWVQRGEVIARIDDAEYQQAVLEAEANLKIAQASLTEARSQFALAGQDLDRAQTLQEKGIASAAELDAATTNFDAQQSRLKLAQAQVEQKEAALTSARIRLNYTVLVATEPGYIGERFVDEGSLLAPNSPIMSVIGIDSVIVRTTIIERDYGRIQIGQEAEVEVDAFPSIGFTGRVARMAPMLQQASRMAQMEVEVANDSLMLKPGMFARVNVVLAQRDSTQIVPSQAVVTIEGQKGVFVIDQGNSTARYIPVQEGIVTPERTEILSPALQGLVVTLGQHLLADGSPVILPQPDGIGQPGSSPDAEHQSGPKDSQP
jgi:RND family efflux transporter MFP subunit